MANYTAFALYLVYLIWFSTSFHHVHAEISFLGSPDEHVPARRLGLQRRGRAYSNYNHYEDHPYDENRVEVCRLYPALCCQLWPDWHGLCGPPDSTLYEHFCLWYPGHWYCRDETNVCEFTENAQGCRPFCAVYTNFDFCQPGFCEAHPGYLGCILDDLSLCVLAPHLPGCRYPGFPAMGSSHGLWPFSVCAAYPSFDGCNDLTPDMSPTPVGKTPTEIFCEIHPEFSPFCDEGFDICRLNNMAVGCTDYCASEEGTLYPACQPGYCDEHPKFFGCGKGYDICPFYSVEGCPAYPGLQYNHHEDDQDEDDDQDEVPYFPGYDPYHPGGGYFPCPGVPMPIAYLIVIPLYNYNAEPCWPRPERPHRPPVPEPEPCGSIHCPIGEVCCNESCEICTPPGGSCIEKFCLDDDEPEPEPEKCGSIHCPIGQECCNESCGICTPPGGSCIQIACTDDDKPEPEPEKCGSIHCPIGQVCCNESCGICTPPGGSCIQIACPPDDDKPEPEPEECGSVHCPIGEVCCNESCGICTPPGGSCTRQFCLDDDGPIKEEDDKVYIDDDCEPAGKGDHGKGRYGKGKKERNYKSDYSGKGKKDRSYKDDFSGKGKKEKSYDHDSYGKKESKHGKGKKEYRSYDDDCDNDRGTNHSDRETCGLTLCDYGEVCCNASCSICAKPGELCLTAHCGHI